MRGTVSPGIAKTGFSALIDIMWAADTGKTGIAAASFCQVFTVGPNLFQNELLAAYIRTHTTWKTIAAATLTDIRPVGPPAEHTAVLYDCAAMAGGELPSELVKDLELLPPGWLALLFNLSREATVEKMAIKAGIHGFFYQDDCLKTVIRGIAAVFGGELWVSRQKITEILTGYEFRARPRTAPVSNHVHDLTKREMEILELLSSGATNDAIGDKLFISPHTVRTHLNHIFKKINAANRVEASLWAAELLGGKRP